VRTTLETQMAAAAAEPTRVTLGGQFTVSDAFAAIEQQTGNRFVGDERRSGQVELNWQNVPFWQAVDQLLDQEQLRINSFGGETDALVLEARPEQEQARATSGVYVGLFRLEPIRLEARRDLRNPSVNSLRVTIEVAWEPRSRPIALQLPLDQLKAIDDRGNPLTVASSRGNLTPLIETGVSSVELIVPMELPQDQAQRIATLSGKLYAVLPGTRTKFEFTDLADSRDVEQQRAGVTVIFERLRRNVDLYEVRVRVRFEDAGESLQSHHGWVFNNPAYLRDAAGQKIENVSVLTTRQDPTEVGLAYLFPLPQGPEGCTFWYETPATILRLPVEFAVRDIELP
jgi:hypothetical protein